MGADSQVRRLVKQTAHRVLGEGGYGWVQALAMAADIRAGRLSEPELEVVVSAVSPGDVVVDMGANYGMYTYPLDRAVGRGGRVYAFEPVPFTFAVLRRVGRLLRLRNVELVAKGCGKEPGTMSFTVPVQDSGAISAGQAHLSSRDDERPGKATHVRWPHEEEVRCEIVALDDLLPTQSNVSLIKSDIEGAELFAFQGAADLIDRNHPTVLAEINPWFLEGFGQTVDDLVSFFATRGYSLYRYDEATRMLVEQAPDEVVEDNYLFVHPDRADRLAPFLRAPAAEA